MSHVFETMLICSNKDTTSGPTAAVGHHLVVLMVHCHTSESFRLWGEGTNWQINEGMMATIISGWIL